VVSDDQPNAREGQVGRLGGKREFAAPFAFESLMHEVSTKIGGHLAMADDDQKLRVRLVGRNGRRRYEAASKEVLSRPASSLGFDIEACTRTWGQREPSSEVDQEPHPDQVAAAVFTRGVHPGSAGWDCQSNSVAARQRGDGGFAGGLRWRAWFGAQRGYSFCSPAKLSVSLPNGVKLALECGDVDALTAIIEHLAMFRLGDDLQVYLHREPSDFRAGINSLAVLVQETMTLDPFAPAVFAFCNRRCDRIKLLFFDRSGFVLVLKR